MILSVSIIEYNGIKIRVRKRIASRHDGATWNAGTR